MNATHNKPMDLPWRRAACVALLALASAGCELRKAMYDQPKLKALQASDFFSDGRASRPLPEGTVARGLLKDDSHLYDGLVDGKQATNFPFRITQDDLLRGQERFRIFCTPCHDRAGTGHGMIVQRGFKQPPSYHIDRLRTSPPGYFYNVIKNGFGQMPGYAPQIPVEDRWRIVAYVKALQMSQDAPVDQLPAPLQAQVK